MEPPPGPYSRQSPFGGPRESPLPSLSSRLFSSSAGNIASGRSQQLYEPPGRRESDFSSRGPPPTPPASVGYPAHHFIPRDVPPHAKSTQPAPSSSSYLATPPLPDSSYSAYRPPSHPTRELGLKHGHSLSRDHNNLYHEASGPSPPMSREMSHHSQPYDHVRRRSLGSTGSPPVYPAAGHADHPPSVQGPSYGARQMPPPPSSPQHFQGRPVPMQPPHHPSGLPPPQSHYAPRELSATPSSSHRTGGSMTISSILGSDNDRPPRETNAPSLFSRPQIPPMPAAPAPISGSGKMSPPPAPPRQQSSDYPPFGRSHTPDRNIFSKPTSRPYRSDSGGGPVPVSQPSADDSRLGSLSRPHGGPTYAERSMPQSPRSAYIESSYSSGDRRMSLGAPIPRPNSQPQHLPQPEEPRPSLFTPVDRLTGFREKASGPPRTGPGFATHEAPSHLPHSRYSGLPSEPHNRELLSREHVQEPKQPPQSHSRYGPPPPDRDERPPRAPWDSNMQRLSPEATRYQPSEPGPGFGYGGVHTYNKSMGSQIEGSRAAPAPAPQVQARQGAPPPSQESSPTSTRRFPPRIFSPPTGSRSSSFAVSSAEEQHPPRTAAEEPLHHRSILNISTESKRGRVSPLPQAVQGAQAQLIRPAGEQGIQSELGRVFSGIGSGVGVSGSGPSTPLSGTPYKKDTPGRPLNQELNESAIHGAKPPRSNSRRSRKIKDEEAREEAESLSAQREAGFGRGGTAARRGRHVHHHHHPGHHIGHHHHHHRHKEPDDASPLTAQPSGSLKQGFLPERPIGSSAPSALHQHHHHRHRHHHHHLVPQSSGAITPHPISPTVPTKEFSTVVKLDSILKSVQHIPRYHLGSTLYAPRISEPSPGAPPEVTKFGYSSTPVPIPRFDGKENCTFTIRVPRFRIDAPRREEICARRALWGTGVYTDDSDPVAAAIHSGFIRGQWGEDVDISLLDLEIREQHQHAPHAGGSADKTGKAEQEDKTKTKRRIPPIPPPDKDLHITLLILPTLQLYESSVMYGLKSRRWGDNHDGMSFKVEKVEWVDEGGSNGQERGGEARRKRLKSMMRSGRICTAAGMKGRGGIELLAKKKLSKAEIANNTSSAKDQVVDAAA